MFIKLWNITTAGTPNWNEFQLFRTDASISLFNDSLFRQIGNHAPCLSAVAATKMEKVTRLGAATGPFSH